MNQSCEYCGNSFHAERVTARFCSTKCRVKFNREQKRDKKTTLPAAIDSVRLATLIDESEKINHSLRQSIAELKVNRTNHLIERLERLREENSRILAEIVHLVAN